MKGKWWLIIILVIVFSGGRMALADGNHKSIPSTSSLNEDSENNMEGMDMSGDTNSKSHDQEGTTEGDNMEGMDMKESSSHSHEPVMETPPNMKVLGTYGAVNLSFIMIGVWNKWLRRKGGMDGDSK